MLVSEVFVWLTLCVLYVDQATTPRHRSDPICPDSNFQCDGECQPLVWVCDGFEDCKDGSDEKRCPRDATSQGNCTDLQFHCGGDLCIGFDRLCDFSEDCPDGSDESNCETFHCGAGEFKCEGIPGKCIPSGSRCDRKVDCPDGSDEQGCTSCDETKFSCADGGCIDRRLRCDGGKECLDGSDEANCTQSCHGGSQFECSPGICVDKLLVCDGRGDCPSGEDERGCPSTFTCAIPSHFECSSGSQCINPKWVCDGRPDCGDRSDEEESLCSSASCLGGFKCGDGRCIEEALRCSGSADCADGSDEKNCPLGTQACDAEVQFACRNGSCIPKESVCDGKDDCVGGADEPATCNLNECLENNGNCQHACVDTLMGFYCRCHEGFHMVGDQCVDINECFKWGSCSQLCHNTNGSYHCSCFDGYEQDAAMPHLCKATRAYLLIGDQEGISRSHLDGQNSVVILPERHPRSLGYLFAHNITLVWSEAGEKEVYVAKVDNASVIQKVPSLSSRNVTSLAVDWIHQYIYWIDSDKRVIGVSDFGGNASIEIIKEEMFEPQSLVLEPENGWLYWINSGNGSKIERAGTDGNARSAFITEDVAAVSSLAMDTMHQRLYWADGLLNKISCVKTDGLHRLDVLHSPSISNPHSLVVFEDWIFWIERDGGVLFRANKFDGSGLTPLAPMSGRLLTSVSAVHEYKQPHHPNVCSQAKCSHFCLPSPRPHRPDSGREFKCVCLDGFRLASDHEACDSSDLLASNKTFLHALSENGVSSSAIHAGTIFSVVLVIAVVRWLPVP